VDRRAGPVLRRQDGVGDELGIEVRSADHGALFVDGALGEVGNPFPQETKDADQGPRRRYDGRKGLEARLSTRQGLIRGHSSGCSGFPGSSSFFAFRRVLRFFM
jgi:hypothetical protein